MEETDRGVVEETDPGVDSKVDKVRPTKSAITAMNTDILLENVLLHRKTEERAWVFMRIRHLTSLLL